MVLLGNDNEQVSGEKGPCCFPRSFFPSFCLAPFRWSRRTCQRKRRRKVHPAKIRDNYCPYLLRYICLDFSATVLKICWKYLAGSCVDYFWKCDSKILPKIQLWKNCPWYFDRLGIHLQTHEDFPGLKTITIREKNCH